MKTEVKKPNKPIGSFASKSAKKENPFDKFANPRKKHDILNRRVKGEDRNVGRARAKAVDERKKKLLQDYRSTKKSNSILDKRFGESDPTMSLEEKMFLRFQKERSKKARNSSLYNLGDEGEEAMLTHKGQILGESNVMDHDDFASSDDDEAGSGKLNKDVVNSLHFGGGFVPKEQDGGSAPKKGRLEALQEIVMKSKMFKAQRKEAKEEQESERVRIDAAFDDLVRSDLVDMDNKRFKKSYSATEVDDYDKLMVDMAYETKAQPAERTKTAEELAMNEREKMEELEKARLKRMREAAAEVSQGVGGGKAGRGGAQAPQTKRVRNDDELDDFYFQKLNEDRYGDKTLTAPASAQDYTSDDHEDDDGDEDDGDEDAMDDDDDDGDEDESGDEDDDDEDAEDDEEEEEEEDGDELDDGEDVDGFDQDDDGGDADSDDDDAVDGDVAAPATFDHIPHTMLCPSDSAAFDELLRRHCRYFPHDQMEVINRIVSWNNVHLPGEKGQENRKLMHNFLDVLMKYFVRLGGKLPTASATAGYKTLLNHVNRVIFAISRDLPESSVSLWSRTLKILYQQYQKQTRDFAQGVETTCWPSLGKLMLFQTLGHVFSTTDLRNDMVNPAELMLCQWLTQCPVTTVRDLSLGVFAAGVLLDYSAESRRLYPEVVAFLASALAAFAPATFAQTARSFSESFLLGTFAYGALNTSFRQALAPSTTAATGTAPSSSSAKKHAKGAAATVAEAPAAPAQRIDWRVFATSTDATAPVTEPVAASLLYALYHMVEVLASRMDTAASASPSSSAADAAAGSAHHSSAPEVLHPVLHMLQVMRPHDATAIAWHTTYQARHLAVLEHVSRVSETVRRTRAPLLWRKMVTSVVDSKAPRFEATYVIKKDADSDKDRAKLKQLTRQLKREKKAAMRELRRDSAFLDQERFQEKQAIATAKRAERVKNYAWLENQQATINEQVRKGKDLLKGGGSAAARGPKPGRR